MVTLGLLQTGSKILDNVRRPFGSAGYTNQQSCPVTEWGF